MKSVSGILFAGMMLVVVTVAGETWSGRLLAAEGDKSTATPSTSAATSDNKSPGSVEERVKIKPYTGPAILLDEPEQIAEPTIVKRDKILDPYENGKPRVEREVARYSDNHFEADGAYREYYPNSQLFVQGQFRRGRQDGDWTYWYENGKENRKATYKNGQPDGAWEVHRADGTLSAKRGFREGLRDGDWVVYDDKGEMPLREEHYDKGKKVGTWKTWYPSGKVQQEINFKDDKKDGKNIEWREDGTKRAEITYVDDKPHGTATAWLTDGRTIVQEYKDGKLVSEAKK